MPQNAGYLVFGKEKGMKKQQKEKNQRAFAKQLIRWNTSDNNRQMPWKGQKDPYKIWLSEIILQQTRVEQGLGYYNRFIHKYPTIHHLAKAPDNEVFKLWEGLGYYSRCRNLIATARKIADERNGVFPDSYEEIIRLKGIGPYTAAAIASFAYNLPYAVVDGNVFRVLARVFGIDKAIDSTNGKKYFSQLAETLLDKRQPALYNQAIMDFGATICKPAPLCTACVFNKECYAYLHDKIAELPVKEKKMTIKKRWFTYFLLEYKRNIALQKRENKDIWQGLYQFPLIETKEEEPVAVLIKKILQPSTKYKLKTVSVVKKQQLSHQLIQGRFVHLLVDNKPTLTGDYEWVTRSKVKNYPFPKFINEYITEELIL